MERSLAPILASMEAWGPIANDPIMWGDSYVYLDNSNIKICPLVMILPIVVEEKFLFYF